MRWWERVPAYGVRIAAVLSVASPLLILASVAVIYGTVLLYTCPRTFDPQFCSRANFLGIFVVFQLLLNLVFFRYYVRQNDPTRWAKSVLKNGQVQGCAAAGKFCIECNRMAPKRSYHCPLCDMCVLRKDHHCFMTGACIGIANQRYFTVFSLWAGLGSGLGSFFLLAYLVVYSETSMLPFGWMRLLAPVAIIGWLAGAWPLSYLAICGLFNTAWMLTVMPLLFFASQMFYTLKGSTTYDYNVLRKRCDLREDGETVSERLQLVFGRYWLLNFIFPQPWFPNRVTPQIANNIFNMGDKDS